MRKSSRIAGKLAACVSLRWWFWACMLVLHGVALPSLWTSLSGDVEPGTRLVLLARLAGLLAMAGFFVLKMLDVPWLRLKPGWRSGVTAVVVVAVLHVGVFDRVVGGEFQFDPAHLGLVFFIGSIWLAERIRRRIRLALAVAAPAGVRHARRWDARLGRAWEAALPPPTQFCVPSLIGPRAPPVR